MKQLISMLCMLLVAGCQATDPLSVKSDPKSEWWELAFVEPDYMKVWVENSSVQDVTGKIFHKTGGGSAAGGEPEDGTESARGWTGGVGGSGKRVVGADLPSVFGFVGNRLWNRRRGRRRWIFLKRPGS